MNFTNKRKYQRYASLNLSYICLDEQDQIIKQGMGRTLNISESGILLETHFPIEREYMLVLTIGLEDDLLDIKGKPIHVTSNEEGIFEVGIEFLNPDQDSARLLKDFIRRIAERDVSDSTGDVAE